MNRRLGAISALLSTLMFAVGCTGSGSGDSVDGSPNVDSPAGSGSSASGPGVSDELANPQVRSTDQVYPYRPDGPYAAVLSGCTLTTTVANSCSLATLPFIGQDNPNPGVDDIMNRVLVTHDWMGDRFEQIVSEAPDDLRQLFASTTSILIGSEVRPSFYTRLTAGIQLDPVYLWMSVPEKQTISTEADFRQDFGADLQFVFFRRFVIGEEPAFGSYSLLDDSEREFNDVLLPTVRLLYHELAHAGDFMPATQLTDLDVSLQPLDAIDANLPFWLSPQLYADFPLNQEELVGLADVRFRGADASAEQQSVLADYVGALMDNDGAMQFYSYFTIREDFATLFESVMMARHYDVRSNVAFINKPEDPDSASCADYLVSWGIRNRLASSRVLPRAQRVAEQLFATTSGSTVADDLSNFLLTEAGNASSMRIGDDWCSNQSVAPPADAARHRGAFATLPDAVLQDLFDGN